MEIQKTFELAASPDRVWDAFGDVTLVAACLPGAEIVGALGDDRWKGRFSVKLGPLAAAFEGEVAIARQPQERSGSVSGKGSDRGSGSRASGTLSYRVAAADAPGRSRVEVVCELTLAGALAQFGKAAVIREIANRITADFVRNFEARLAATAPAAAAPAAAAPAAAPAAAAPPPAAPASAAAPPALDAGGLLWSILRDRVVQFFRALFGRKARP
jgi:uncharacterized protein